MIKKVIFVLIIAVAIVAASIYGYRSYQHQNIVKNTAEITKQYASQLTHDTFPISGSYRWTFYLGPIKQVSTHRFAPTFIDYQMRGKAHSTDYRMEQLSYDDAEKKWVGQTPEGIVYVLFFKNSSANRITLYKRKCTNGLPEALSLKRPSADETADHGWNIYTRAGEKEPIDLLPFSGRYAQATNANSILEINDDQAQWDEKTYQKLTHHLGERRWVGQLDDTYLVIFYEQAPDNSLRFSLQTYTDVDKAYKSKHDQQTFTTYTKK